MVYMKNIVPLVMFINKCNVVFFSKFEKCYFYFLAIFPFQRCPIPLFLWPLPPFWLPTLKNLLQPCRYALFWGSINKEGEEAMMVRKIFKFMVFKLQENAFAIQKWLKVDIFYP